MAEYIYTVRHNLDPYFCQHIIDTYNSYSNAVFYPDASDEADVFQQGLSDGLERYYADVMRFTDPEMIDFLSPTACNTGFTLSSLIQGQTYEHGNEWKDDSWVTETHHRFMAYIWFLNAMPGGRQEQEQEQRQGDCFGDVRFPFCSIRPEQGMLLLYPATWTYMHQDCCFNQNYADIDAANARYTVSGYILLKNDGDAWEGTE